MNKLALLLLPLSLCLSGCGSPSDETPDPKTAPLANAKMGGAFTLVDQNGRPTTQAALKGRYALVYFGYTFCPDVCPVDASTMGQAVSAFEKAFPDRGARLLPVFITADPARDTPAALKQFLGNFHLRFLGLTGTEAQIDATAKLYGVPILREKPDKNGNYLVVHPRYTTLYGPDGKPLAFIPVDQGVDASVAELRRWVR
jgi:protein SCO1